jgi:IS30 family transposase
LEAKYPGEEARNTLTLDNGKEFAAHAGLSQALCIDMYFAHPYHSRERGLNEHTNGLIR